MTTLPPSLAILARTFASREKGGLAYAKPIAFQKERKALFICFEQYNCRMCCCWLVKNSTWISSRET